jgi:hypothetical protein
MSNATTQTHAESIRSYVEGLARKPGALDLMRLSLLSQPEQWRKLAIHRLHMRQTGLLDVMSDTELEAIGTGQVDLWSIVKTVDIGSAGSTINSELLRHHGETISSALDAQQRWNDGQRIFAFHDQDGEPHLVRSYEELNSYAPDQLLGLPALQVSTTELSEEPTDPSILETIELIAKRKLGHTVQTRNRDSLDFFEVHTAVVQEALLAAFMAGMQFKNA